MEGCGWNVRREGVVTGRKGVDGGGVKGEEGEGSMGVARGFGEIEWRVGGREWWESKMDRKMGKGEVGDMGVIGGLSVFDESCLV